MTRVAIVAGARTPCVKAGQAFSRLGPLAPATHAVRGLVERHKVDPAGIEAIAFGAVVPERGKPNIAREIVFEAGLPASIEAQTVSSYCITGLRTATIIADAIARGRIKSRLVASWHKKRLIPARGSGPVHAGYANSSIAFDDRPNGSYWPKEDEIPTVGIRPEANVREVLILASSAPRLHCQLIFFE